MKVLILILTILFSASVLADCCNFEIETNFDQCQTMDSDGDHCSESSNQHSEAEHCKCSQANHLRILAVDHILIKLPTFDLVEHFFSFEQFHDSSFESSIFHPPIA